MLYIKNGKVIDIKLIVMLNIYINIYLCRCLYDQIATYFEQIISRYQWGFCKCYSAQYCLLAMIEKW